MSTASCILLGNHIVSTVIGCWLVPNHWLTIRRFVQNIQEQLISQKSRGNHTSVLTATRDIHVLLMWSAIANPNIPMYSCAWTDAFCGRTDTSCAWMDTFCTWTDTCVFIVHLRSLYYIFILSVCTCIHSSLVIPLHHHYCTTSSPYVSFVNASVWHLPAA